MRKTTIILILTLTYLISNAKVKSEWRNGHYFVHSSKVELKSDNSKISPYFEIWVDLDELWHCYICLKFYSNKLVSWPAGSKMLIRTGSGNVYEGETITEYSNNATIENNYNSSSYQLTSVGTSYTDLHVKFKFSKEAFLDIAENGIIKIRTLKKGVDVVPGGDWILDGKHLNKNEKNLKQTFVEMFTFINKEQEEIFVRKCWRTIMWIDMLERKETNEKNYEF